MAWKREKRVPKKPQPDPEYDQPNDGVAGEAMQAVGFTRREPGEQHEEGKRPVIRAQRPVPYLDHVRRIMMRAGMATVRRATL